MSEQPEEEINNPKEREITARFMGSFENSQGDNLLQPLIFEWLRKNGLVSLDSITSPELPEYIGDLRHIPPPHKPVDDYLFIRQLQFMWRQLYAVVARKPELIGISGNDDLHLLAMRSEDYPDDYLLAHMAVRMFQVELKFQGKPREGRPENQEGVIPDSSKDAHASFLRRHLILGQSPGFDPAFGLLYQQVDPFVQSTERLKQQFADDSPLSKRAYYDLLTDHPDPWVDLKRAWERNHPKHQFLKKNP